MTHVVLRDNNPKSLTKGQSVTIPVTVIECPVLKPLSLRFYSRSLGVLSLTAEVFADKLDKMFKKPKKEGKVPESFDEIRLVIYTQPKTTGIGKKKPDLLELQVAGKSKEEKLKTAQELLQKDIKISEVFKEGQYLDVHGVTRGKGFQGTVKRFGVKIRQHKSEKVKRGVGNLGAWTPKKVSFRVPQPGKMGYHKRTEYNKWLIKVGNKPEDVNPKGGFLQYGLVKNEYVLIKGSIPGPAKRAIVLTEPLRTLKKQETPEVTYISTESKQ
jgi:large subunit ribosomal protein L3